VHFQSDNHLKTTPLAYASLLPRSASGLLFRCWQPNISGCWPLGVELPATGGYVGTVSGDLPHSTQDVSVHWIISWHLADLTFLCLHTVYSGPSSCDHHGRHEYHPYNDDKQDKGKQTAARNSS